MAVVINELTVVTPAPAGEGAGEPAAASTAPPTAAPAAPSPPALSAALERQDRHARRLFAH